jgi:y4mF family transcriptional regulator
MDISADIKNLRRAAGMTQEQLAQRAGVGLRFIREVEQGTRNPSINKVNRVLDLFGCHVEVVTDRTSSMLMQMPWKAFSHAAAVHEPPGVYETTCRKVIIIAGPNGSGKTTFATQFLPKEACCPVFVNADLISAGLSPFLQGSALRAGRLMLAEIHRHVRDDSSFAFETTLSGLAYARSICAWRSQGYGVKLVFLSLKRVELAVERVAARVAQGGHDVPEDIIRRRYHAGWKHFNEVYRDLVDVWSVYDNSGPRPVLREEGENG